MLLIGTKIQEYRKKLDLSQEEFAAADDNPEAAEAAYYLEWMDIRIL